MRPWRDPRMLRKAVLSLDVLSVALVSLRVFVGPSALLGSETLTSLDLSLGSRCRMAGTPDLFVDVKRLVVD